MYRERIKIGVFCGFGNNPLGEGGGLSEKDFAYQLLCIFDHGELAEDEKKQNVGQDHLNANFLRSNFKGPYEFLLPPEWYGENPWTASRKIVKECDLILAVFPQRSTGDSGSLDSRTSLYTMLEVALAHGSHVPILPIVEAGVEPKALSAISEFLSWRRDIARDRIQDAVRSKTLNEEFRALVDEMLLESRNLRTFGSEDVDLLYLHLTETLVSSTVLRIYNHSALPIGSGMDPFDCGNTMFCDYRGVLKEPWNVVPHRAVYFEVEEALSSGDWTRVNSLLEGAAKYFGVRDPIKAKLKEAEELCHRIRLYRAASVVCEAEYEELSKNLLRDHQRQQALARISSIVAQLWRQRRLASGHATTYTLKLFPTISTQSAPTTLYAELRGAKKSERGIWGFLRGPDERTDSFIYAQNHEVVLMWKEYVDRYFGEVGDRYGVRQVHVNGASDLTSLFSIIGEKAASDVTSFFAGMKLQNESRTDTAACVSQEALTWYEDEFDQWKTNKQNAAAG